MKILACIATYNRPEKVKRCIDSILNQTWKKIDIMVCADNNDIETMDYIDLKFPSNEYPNIDVIINERQLFVGGCWNKIIKYGKTERDDIYDGYLMLVDDVVLEPNCVENAVFDMGRVFGGDKFKGDDAVIGITQTGKQAGFVPAGQCLIGSTFVDRFKEVDYQVYNPEYSHWFIDGELHEYAESLDKFYLSITAKLEHLHPAFYSEEMDDTHKITRGQIMKEDKKTRQLRQEQGLIWGQSFRVDV